MLFVQGNYTSLQQEVESMRSIMEKLRGKYKAAEAEISDLRQEHQQQKSELLDIIRSQEKAVKFSNKVMGILLTDNELYKLHQRSKWDDEKGDWQIPLFTFNPKMKDLNFPQINAKQRVEQSKEDRVLAIQDSNLREDEEGGSDQFRKKNNFKNSDTHTQKSNKKNAGKNGFGSRNYDTTAKNGIQGNYEGIYNHSADENSQENNRGADQSWLEDRFSQDNMSSNNLRDSGSNNGEAGNGTGVQIRSKNVTSGVSVNSLTGTKALSNNEIIPERRRKYLANASDDMQ